MHSLCTAIKSLSELSLYHGDIQPKTVHINLEGEVRILNHALLTQGRRGYNKMLTPEISGYKSILSPLQLNALEAQLNNVGDNFIASDIWAIGMTVMCVCSNRDFNVFYDWENYRIRYDLIKRNYDYMNQLGYSENLISIIDKCLEETEARRIKLGALTTILNQISTEIEDIDNQPQQDHGDTVLGKFVAKHNFMDKNGRYQTSLSNEDDTERTNRSDKIIPTIFLEQHSPVMPPPRINEIVDINLAMQQVRSRRGSPLYDFKGPDSNRQHQQSRTYYTVQEDF